MSRITGEFLYVEVKNLDIDDIVAFTADLCKLKMPQPADCIDFEDVKLYVCPVPMGKSTWFTYGLPCSLKIVLGTVAYPQGVSFDAVCTAFGKKGSIAASFGSGGAKLIGSVDNFSIGPLSVRSASGAPSASVDIELGSSRQHIVIDGAVTLFDVEGIAIQVLFDGVPTPVFSFHLMLHFTPRLMFQVDAAMIGSPKSLHSIEGLDFQLSALFEQDLLQFIATEVEKQIDLARLAADKGFDTAKDAFTTAKAASDKVIADASHKVTATKAAWDEKSKQVHDSNQKIIDAYTAQLRNLQANADSALKGLKQATLNAQNAVTKANTDRDTQMRNAQKQLSDAKTEWAQRIKDAQAGTCVFTLTIFLTPVERDTSIPQPTICIVTLATPNQRLIRRRPK